MFLVRCIALVSSVYGIAFADQTSAQVPWPTIPTPEAYSAPTSPVKVRPISIAKGLTSKSSNSSDSTSLVFHEVGDIYTLDYGVVAAGKPYFSVAALGAEYAQVEVKYTEAWDGLLDYKGDGPFAFANGLAATFRVETFNLTKTGDFTGYFIQGSQRWQSIKLVKGPGLVLTEPAFISSVDTTPAATQPGYFASSNSTYTDIWALSILTEQLTCLQPMTQSSTWDITENGAYVRGQKPATTTRVTNVSNYTLTFETNIDFGGTGWRVDTEIDAIQATGPIFVLTSEYPEGSFSNIDTTLVPPNSLIVGRGWSLQNQTSLPGYVLEIFPLSVNVTEKEWHTIDTVSHGDDTYTVYLDGLEISHFNISSYGLGDANPFIPGGYYKSFAFGPWQHQAAWIRNVNVTTSIGETIYSNPMKSADVLVEYSVHSNLEIVSSDAGKRDRFSWLGDRLISARATMVSTHSEECVWGPAEQALDRQISSGQVPIDTLFSPLDPQGVLVRTKNVDPLIVDYMFDFLITIYHYWYSSGNDTFLETHWTEMVSVLSYAISESLDPDTQLFGKPSGSSGTSLSGEKGQALGPADTVSLIMGLEKMAEMAAYLGHDTVVPVWLAQAQASRDAIDNLLWNATSGYYASTSGADGFDLIDIAQVLVGKIGSAERREQFLGHLGELKVAAGYMNGTRFFDTVPVVNPYYISFLLEGLALAGETSLAQAILDDTYGPMVERGVNYTGGYWEYVVDGTYPGLDLFTGMSHYWGSYPTVFLTEYALGVRPTDLGYSKFVFAPIVGFKTDWVQGRVPTPHGMIYAAWGFDATGKVVMEISAPAGTECTIVPPFSGLWAVDGQSSQSGYFTFTGMARLQEE